MGRDNGYKLALVEKARLLGLKDVVRFMGFRKDVADVLPLVDILVNASWHESFSGAILEAMAARCALVATRAGGTPEIITHHVDGILIPPHDPHAMASAILQLSEDDRLRRELGMRAQNRALSLDIREQVRTLASLYGIIFNVTSGNIQRRRPSPPTSVENRYV
jgi:glycosyltransferase involved in cell wall biosynthesis